MKNQKGITLIALVITIIVMLILVGVSVTVALNGGLFTTAKEAANETKTERDKELALSNGEIEFTINGKTYNSMDEYLEEKGTQTECSHETFDEDNLCTECGIKRISFTISKEPAGWDAEADSVIWTSGPLTRYAYEGMTWAEWVEDNSLSNGCYQVQEDMDIISPIGRWRCFRDTY